VCTALERLRELELAWESLATYLGTPIGRWLWAVACAETLEPDVRLFIPEVWRDGALVAVAPLRKPRGLCNTLQQLDGVTGEPSDFSYADGAALDLLAHSLAARRLPLYLARTFADSPALTALRNAYRRRALVLQKQHSECPFIDLGATEEETVAGLSPKLRSDLKRAMRRAEQMGAVSVEVHAPSTSDDLAPLWEEALRVEAAGWKGRRGSALMMNPRSGPFFQTYVARACERAILRILFVRVDSEAASCMIALEAKERFWVLKIGYDERFSKCSPGMLVMEAGLRYAARQGLTSFEFLGSGAAWTRRWTDRGRRTAGIVIYPYTLRGALVMMCDLVRFVRRKVRDRLRGKRR
jgi:CelD/BcsL family acetyltransferase involved in cellulose biosynthesis